MRVQHDETIVDEVARAVQVRQRDLIKLVDEARHLEAFATQLSYIHFRVVFELFRGDFEVAFLMDEVERPVDDQ